MSVSKSSQWYLQLNGESRGPFPAWQISRYLLLKRLHRQSLVSRDGENWMAVSEITELQPERRMAIPDLPEQERQLLDATQAWMERHPELFRDEHAPRADEVAGAVVTTHLKPQPPGRPSRTLAYVVVVALLLSVVAIPYIIPSAPQLAEPQCEAVAAPAVNWSNCRMPNSYLVASKLTAAVLRNVNLNSSDLTRADLSGADLAYANLALSEMAEAQLPQALLKGANLRNVNLRNANLQGADLSYADLTGANLEGANLSNARLGYAVWEENISCMPESVGKCIPARSAAAPAGR